MQRRLPERVRSERLELRRWAETDAPLLSAAIAASIDHLRPWMAWIAEEPMPLDRRRTQIVEWTQNWEDGGDVVFGVFLQNRDGTETLVGGAGFHRRIGPDGLEIGYWLHADHVGRGYATELSSALTSAAFTLPGIERVEIHHDARNVRSAAVPRRLGYDLVVETSSERAWRVTRDVWLETHPPED